MSRATTDWHNLSANTIERFGVQQTEITIAYRFGQAEERAGFDNTNLLIPRHYSIGLIPRIAVLFRRKRATLPLVSASTSRNAAPAGDRKRRLDGRLTEVHFEIL